MRISVVGMKGGVAKSQTAWHIAAYLQRLAPTLLVDGDQNKSLIEMNQRGEGAPFAVVDVKHAKKFAPKFTHVVVDSAARPSNTELEDLKHSDLIIVPTPPDAISLAALLHTISALREIGANRFKILLTLVPPRPSRDGDEAREILEANSLPVFDGVVHRRVAFQKAALQGLTVDRVSDPRAGEAWAEYDAIGKQILK